jgi:hypothetical protein
VHRERNESGGCQFALSGSPTAKATQLA